MDLIIPPNIIIPRERNNLCTYFGDCIIFEITQVDGFCKVSRGAVGATLAFAEPGRVTELSQH